MEITTTFVNDNDHGFNEHQRAEDIDHMIMAVTERARRLSQETDPVHSAVIMPERSSAEESKYVHTDTG